MGFIALFIFYLIPGIRGSHLSGMSAVQCWYSVGHIKWPCFFSCPEAQVKGVHPDAFHLMVHPSSAEAVWEITLPEPV